jgi:CRISPR system Cascade subunit CasA
MTTFNLIDNPWIPVRWHPSATGGKPRLVSLHVAFARSREIADLDAAPHERIALTRLLVCIAHAALGAPDAATDYLKRLDIHPHFNLFGDGPRFLQEAVPEKGETVSASKLFPRLATGNNPTVLDHGGMSARRNFEPAALALALLTFQNFYPLYGAGYKGRGPCADANGIHCVLLGQQLRETIIHNMLDAESLSRTAHESFGRPIWECKTTAELEMSTQTLLGRLVPRHRSLRLASDLTGFFHSNKSLIYPNWEPHREPSVSIVVNRKGDRRIAPARLDRSIWRDLHHLTALRAGDETNPDASLILQSHREALENETVDLWTGALITDLKAKILDTAESTFTVPRGLFGAAGRSLYTAGVEYAHFHQTLRSHPHIRLFPEP